MAAFSHNAFSRSAFDPNAFSITATPVAVGDQIVTSWAIVGFENKVLNSAKLVGTRSRCAQIKGAITKETCING